MGLFSRNKKAPRVPFPQPRVVDEHALQFPRTLSSERIIELEKLKSVAGLTLPSQKEMMPPPLPRQVEKTGIPTFPQQPPVFNAPPSMPAQEKTLQQTVPVIQGGPLYIKMEVYQQIMDTLNDVSSSLNELSSASRMLTQAEYTEENGFSKLKKQMKLIHDHILHVDVVLFKSRE